MVGLNGLRWTKGSISNSLRELCKGVGERRKRSDAQVAVEEMISRNLQGLQHSSQRRFMMTWRRSR